MLRITKLLFLIATLMAVAIEADMIIKPTPPVVGSQESWFHKYIHWPGYLSCYSCQHWYNSGYARIYSKRFTKVLKGMI
jgi:hypothetical protein